MYIVPLTVPLVLYFGLPLLLKRLGARQSMQPAVRWWLLAATSIYLVSWWLPSPLIDGVDTSFTTHFVGGGVFCGVLGVYILRAFGEHGLCRHFGHQQPGSFFAGHLPFELMQNSYFSRFTRLYYNQLTTIAYEGHFEKRTFNKTDY